MITTPDDAARVSIERYLAGGMSEEEAAEFLGSLSRSPEGLAYLGEALEQQALLFDILRQEARAGEGRRRGPRRPVRLRRRRPRRGGYGAFIGAGLAAAAAVVIAALVWRSPGERYPEPQISGAYEVEPRGAVGRGSVVRTKDGPAELILGGYCRVEIEPRSRLTLEGEDRAEAVSLGRGGATCEVDAGAGSFAVRTEMGTVSVAGTKFTVRVARGEGEEEMSVRVLAGTVLLSGLWGETSVGAGEQAGCLVGILTAKDGGWIEVKAEGEEEAKRYEFSLRAIKKLMVPNLVKLVWKRDKRPRVVSVRTLAPSGNSGVLTGTVAAKGEEWIDVRPAGGPTERYMPQWVGRMPDRGGSFDRDMLRAFSRLEVGEEVKVGWIYNERKRVVRLGANLLTDPGFERGGSGWEKAHSGVRSVVDGPVHSGRKAHQIIVEREYYAEVYQVVQVAAGEAYEAWGWVRTDRVGGRGAALSIMWLNSSAGERDFGDAERLAREGAVARTDVLGSVTGTRGWTQLEGRLVAPEGAAFARFRFLAHPDPDGSGRAWFDDLYFRECW